ncbi:MAG TPA: UDP-N-acetylmuramoyl-tripeptide--D-alanyl-D-alanine ligase [Actinomycetota bacterium]|nr:UDP-N-acetylmuramoyl-tripeptide--D-alanyl-D-alanine ligase [Actinomycetota bacterium]
MNLSLPDAARVLGADPSGLARGVRITGAVVDSRLVKPGDAFFALQGDFLDGHDFVREALRKGAAAVVVGREVEADPARRIVVPDPAAGLTALAGWLRDVLNPIVVGITGSTGKTSVKDLLTAIVRARMPVVASEKSFNNELGVPLTLLKTRSDTRAVVVEMGTRGIGQIAELCRLARPHIGVVTNVGVAHYEMFGSRAAIARAKGELVEALPEGGAAVLNADDPLVAAMASRRGSMVDLLTYGTSGGAWLRADNLKVDRLGRATFRLARGAQRGVWVSLQASGMHQVNNAMAAATAAMALGLTLEECRIGLEAAEISPWRMQVRQLGEATIVNDAYNASPASVISALQTCAGMVGEGGRLLVILGHMAELGAISETEHLRIGALAASLADRLVAVGTAAEPIAAGATQEGMADVVRVRDAEAAAAAVGPLRPGDVLLVKGSRVAALEKVSDMVAAGTADT